MSKQNKGFWIGDWKIQTQNMVREFRGGYISFNNKIDNNVFKQLGEVVGLKTSDSETALKRKGKWYILNGDFREVYQKCNSIEELLTVYKDNADSKSDWATA